MYHGSYEVASLTEQTPYYMSEPRGSYVSSSYNIYHSTVHGCVIEGGPEYQNNNHDERSIRNWQPPKGKFLSEKTCHIQSCANWTHTVGITRVSHARDSDDLVINAMMFNTSNKHHWWPAWSIVNYQLGTRCVAKPIVTLRLHVCVCMCMRASVMPYCSCMS